MTTDDAHHVATVDQLRAIIGSPSPGVEVKIDDHLGEEAMEFIARSPFLVLSTADAAGNLDASPKGDDPGFVTIQDDQTLLIPDRPGNRLAFGLTNIIENPKVGILFMIPGTTETFRVNGSAELRSDPALLVRMGARSKPAILVIKVTVEQCFFHCSKAFLRSQLWKPETWPERQKISFGAMLARRINGEDQALPEAIDRMIEEDYRTNL